MKSELLAVSHEVVEMARQALSLPPSERERLEVDYRRSEDQVKRLIADILLAKRQGRLEEDDRGFSIKGKL